MKITEIIGVKYLTFINANITGMWLLRAAPNIILDVENKIPFKNPNVDKATKTEIIGENLPITFSTKDL